MGFKCPDDDYPASKLNSEALHKEWMTYNVNDWRRVSVWVKRTENSEWEHAVQEEGAYFINGTRVEPFDMAHLLKQSFAIANAEATK